MNKQATIGSAVVGLVAVGVLWLLSKKDKKAPQVQKKKVMNKPKLQNELQRRHKRELENYLQKLNLQQADTFLKYLWQLEKSALTSGDQDTVDTIYKHVTFLLHLRNVSYSDSNSYMLLKQASSDFPAEIERITKHMAEMPRKICYAMAKGISDCLLDNTLCSERAELMEIAN